jgi:hypothetical protein
LRHAAPLAAKCAGKPWHPEPNISNVPAQYHCSVHHKKSYFMVKAVVSRGEIRPLEPLPADWQEGQRLRVEKADDSEMPVEEIDRDFAVLATLCEASEPADEEQLERALQAARRQAKEQVRRHMGL